MTTTETAAPKAERWTAQWKELYAEVITTGLCTGCAGCVVTCPHDVIGYEHEEGKYIPFHLEEELGFDNCIHGEKGCTTCTRACPRFRAWEPAADMHLYGRLREPDEMAGIWRQLLLTKAADDTVNEVGQDGGFVSAMLLWLMKNDYIDGALVSGVEADDAWKAKPVLARTPEDVMATAGSRYTYCANPLALREAKEAGLNRLALVGMGCQTSSPPTMWDRKAGKVSKPFHFTIGLLCSKTFDDAIFPELFEAKYGLKKQDMVKMNIKGAFQIWMKDGSFHEIDLKECHKWTREGCKSCPDFAAEHSDIATGGIGKDNNWTLTIVRTELGEEVINRMIADGAIIAKPAQEDEVAMKLLRTLSIVSRRRWPEWADKAPSVGVPPPTDATGPVCARPESVQAEEELGWAVRPTPQAIAISPTRAAWASLNSRPLVSGLSSSSLSSPKKRSMTQPASRCVSPSSLTYVRTHRSRVWSRVFRTAPQEQSAATSATARRGLRHRATRRSVPAGDRPDSLRRHRCGCGCGRRGGGRRGRGQRGQRRTCPSAVRHIRECGERHDAVPVRNQDRYRLPQRLQRGPALQVPDPDC